MHIGVEIYAKETLKLAPTVVSLSDLLLFLFL
jgi:hypothetical protein